MRLMLLVVAAMLAAQVPVLCQTHPSTLEKLNGFPSAVINKVNKKTSLLEKKLTGQTEKYLARLSKLETRLRKKLVKLDSAEAERVFAGSTAAYTRLGEMIKSNRAGQQLSGEYLPAMDSLKTSLLFLQQNPGLISGTGITTGHLHNSLAGVEQLQSKFRETEQVRRFIQHRKDQLKETFGRYSQLPKNISKDLGRLNRQAYYYSQQVREYKELFSDPGKLEKKAWGLVNRLPAFQQFMKEHSQLTRLFNLQANYGTPQAIAGLQTRVQVQQLLQNQVTAAGPNAQQLLLQHVQQAKAQLTQLKNRLMATGGGTNDRDMPDFKPNKQKTKSFWKRLEYGSNLQTTKSSIFFPTTTDVGLSVGYKLNDKSIIGIGASYKVGLGKNIRQIQVTQEGVGFRSFADVKLKGSFFLSGGYEYNYQQPGLVQLPSSGQLRGDAWQQSGLAGISKVVSLKSKLFKKTKVQLLWDFLSYGQQPRTAAIKFRAGYNF